MGRKVRVDVCPHVCIWIEFIYNVFYYFYKKKKRVLNISNRVYVNLSLDCIDAESKTLDNCQFLAYAIIRQRA